MVAERFFFQGQGTSDNGFRRCDFKREVQCIIRYHKSKKDLKIRRVAEYLANFLLLLLFFFCCAAKSIS